MIKTILVTLPMMSAVGFAADNEVEYTALAAFINSNEIEQSYEVLKIFESQNSLKLKVRASETKSVVYALFPHSKNFDETVRLIQSLKNEFGPGLDIKIVPVSKIVNGTQDDAMQAIK